MKRILAQAAAVVAATCLLVSCAAETPTKPTETPPPATVSESVAPGVPDGWESRIDQNRLGEQILTGWIEEGKTFAVVIWGSSSCVPIADSIDSNADNSMVLTFRASPNEVCTADMSPSTHTFALPKRVTQRPIELTVVLPDAEQDDVSELS